MSEKAVNAATVKAHFVGGGIGSLAAAAFMIRDGKVPGEHISIYEAMNVVGGALDGAGNAIDGYRLRGGRMLTSDNYECVWDLFKTIPSLEDPRVSVFDETMAFNKQHVPHAQARLVDRNCHKTDVTTMGFSMADRLELVEIAEASEEELGSDRISDWLSPAFFSTNFWFMWQTTFAFQPWHSAVEFKRYLHRFMLEFPRIETLAGVKRTKYNQYDSLVRPLLAWLETKGAHFINNCTVTDFALASEGAAFMIESFDCIRDGKAETVPVAVGDLVFFQNGSMVDASSFGTMSSPPKALTKADSGGWKLWEKLATGRPEFGKPAVFNSHIPKSYWHSFTVTLKDTAFFNHMEKFSGNEAGIGGLVTLFEFELADVGRSVPSAPLSESARGCPGVLGLRVASRSHRQFRRQADSSMLRQRDPDGAVRTSQSRHVHGRVRYLHPVPDAIHHEHVHATRLRGSPTSHSCKHQKFRHDQPVRGNTCRCGFHGGIFRQGRTNGRLPVAWH